MPPVARVTDLHTCPMANPNGSPHVGGPVIGPGVSTVLIGGIPAAVVGDMCSCAGPPDSIVKGSTTVLVAGKPIARMGDQTAHGGVIVQGMANVQAGG